MFAALIWHANIAVKCANIRAPSTIKSTQSTNINDMIATLNPQIVFNVTSIYISLMGNS